MTEMLERAGPKPPPGCAGRAEKLGYWVACVLPLSTETQQKVLHFGGFLGVLASFKSVSWSG